MSEATLERRFFVIGAGFGRTGTSSFKKALEILGVGPCYHMMEVFKNDDAGKWYQFAMNPSDSSAVLNSLLGGNNYKSSCDFPSSPYWKEQLELYPDAKVVLTKRDADKWYQSCIDTIFNMMPNHPNAPFGVKLCHFFGIISPSFGEMVRTIIFDHSMHSDWSKENVIKCYNEHNRRVIDTCPKEKLLVFEVSEGWGPLCKFLDLPVPKEPFPHLNDTQQFRTGVQRRSMMGYAALGASLLGVTVVLMAGSKYLTGSYAPRHRANRRIYGFGGTGAYWCWWCMCRCMYVFGL
jgi:hypothetical protein